MTFSTFSTTRRQEAIDKKAAPIETLIEVERYMTGFRRYRASPLRMAIRGKEVPFQPVDFFVYGRTQRGAGKRCLKKVVAYLKQQAKIHGE